MLASQIHLLYDGAMLTASLDAEEVQHRAGVTTAARAAAEALLDAALADASSGRHRKQEQAEPAGAGRGF